MELEQDASNVKVAGSNPAGGTILKGYRMRRPTPELITGFASFIWYEVIVPVCLTFLVRDPCKTKKCLVKACCQEHCELKIEYLKFCDPEGKILFQRICASSIVLGAVFLCWHIFNTIKHLFT